MPKYEALVHVLWEMPFPLRLAPEVFAIWEPAEGTAFFDPRPAIGELSWKRSSPILRSEALFGDRGPDNSVFPEYDYKVTSTLKTGEEIVTAVLTRGPEGGFAEPRQYTVANIFLCLRDRTTYAAPEVLQRASAALNNVLDIYRFMTMDTFVRPISADQASYYTVVSVADLPTLDDIEPLEALKKISEVKFGSKIGVNRMHHIGLNTFDDLFARESVPKETLATFDTLAAKPHQLELFHQLTLSAIRRIKRKEYALAVLDAQSAFESLVATLISDTLRQSGKSALEIEKTMSPGGALHSLQRRLSELDRFAAAQQTTAQAFLGSPDEAGWRKDLYTLRNRIVHEGLRTVTFDAAKRAVVAGLHAIYAAQALTPSYNRTMIWSGPALDLTHISESAGRLARIFEV